MNEPHATPHLTDEQFADLLSGELTTQELPHLAACAPCRLELERVGLAITDFSRLSLEEADARAALRVQPPARSRILAWRLRPALQAAAAAACISVALLFGLHAHGPATPPWGAPSAPAGQSAAASIAEDNRLMLAIDSALTTTEESTAPLTELQVSEKKTRHASTSELAD